MSLDDLKADEIVQAIRVFLDHAYKEGKVPANRVHFLSLTPDQPVREILEQSKAESLPARSGQDPGGYAFRIGNAWYPHMKLTVIAYGAPPGYVFGVDTHDMFDLPPNAPDYEEVQKLRLRNQELGRAIERAWEEVGLPTQNGLLRQFLNEPQTQQPQGSD